MFVGQLSVNCGLSHRNDFGAKRGKLFFDLLFEKLISKFQKFARRRNAYVRISMHKQVEATLFVLFLFD